jgi:cobalt/nickel transport protein
MNKKELFICLLAALFLGFFISPFASTWPDGLEKTAGDKGFLEKGEVPPALASPVPDYSWPGIKSGRMATALAGLAGALTAFGAAYGIAALLKKKEG